MGGAGWQRENRSKNLGSGGAKEDNKEKKERDMAGYRGQASASQIREAVKIRYTERKK